MVTSIAPQPTSTTDTDTTTGVMSTATRQPAASNTAHIAPIAGSANSMPVIPAAMGFCILVGGALLMF